MKPVEAENEEESKHEQVINLVFDNVIRLANSLPTKLTTDNEIKTAVNQLKRKKCNDSEGWNNEIILEGGNEMINSLKNLFNKMETERFTPRQWKEVQIKTIPKPGSILLMDNKRGLFITEIISKIYERIIKNRNDEEIKKYLSAYQTGGVKGRSTVDNIIVISEIIRRNRKLGRKTYIVYGDAVNG